MKRHVLAVVATLLLPSTACTTGAPALQTTSADGGQDSALPACGSGQVIGGSIHGWSVVATGALSYASNTLIGSEVPIDVEATLTAVDTTAGAFTLAASSGDIEVTLDPVRAEWLEALPLGDAVHARFENGVVLSRVSDGELLLALVGASGSITSPSFDVGRIHVSGGPAECISASYDGVSCWSGSVETDTLLALGSASASAGIDGAPAVIAEDGHAYEVAVVGTVRQASLDEVLASAGHEPCAVGARTATVVAVGRAASALAWCPVRAGTIAPSPGYPPSFPGVTIPTGSSDPSIEGTLASVSGTSLTLATADGSVDIDLAPADPAWVAALPIGRGLRVDHSGGLFVRDAADDALLIAVAGAIANGPAPTFDVGPVHVAGGDARCIAINYASTVGCYVGGTGLDATFGLGASTVSARAGGDAILSDATGSFEVALIASMRQSTGEEMSNVGFNAVCAPLLMSATVVAIRAVTP